MASTEDYFEDYNQPSWSVRSILKRIDISFKNLLTIHSPQVSQPKEITVPLRMHQKALIYQMAEQEKSSTVGIELHDMLTYSNYGVLGDEVGTGKSLTVLGYIAYLKTINHTIQSQTKLFPNSRTNFFSLYKKKYTKANGPSLIIVPHTIYRQWQEYCKKQTTLNVFYAKSHRDLEELEKYKNNPLEHNDISGNTDKEAQLKRNALLKQIQESDVVLVGNTLYYSIQDISNRYDIQWSRIFVDEIDSIYIPSGQASLIAPFVWFITATWPNFIFEGYTIRPRMLEYYTQNSDAFTPELGQWLEEEIGQITTNGVIGRTTTFHMRSSRWLQDFRSEHALRSMTLLMCSKPFLEESRKMPEIIYKTYLCEQPATHRALEGIVNSTIQNMLHAGNVEGALQELGISSDTSTNLVDAVTKEREKELDRLKKTLAFKETMDYTTQQSKDYALSLLQSKIHSVEEQLKTFRERLMNIESEDCPICYEDPRKNSGTLTPCCHRIFCGACILNSLARTMACPMCRTTIKTAQLIQLVETTNTVVSKAPKSTLLNKQKQLIEFLKKESNARVLVFSRYENPFLHLEYNCDSEGISYHTLRGNKDTIASTIRSFEKGEKRVLFLPTASGGAGLNLVNATHVVLLHAMTPEEEKQVIGRAYRLGRTEPLHVIRLLHEGETLHPTT